MTRDEQLDYELMKQKTLEQLYGKYGAFAPLMKSFLDPAIDPEMETNLYEDERFLGN